MAPPPGFEYAAVLNYFWDSKQKTPHLKGRSPHIYIIFKRDIALTNNSALEEEVVDTPIK